MVNEGITAGSTVKILRNVYVENSLAFKKDDVVTVSNITTPHPDWPQNIYVVFSERIGREFSLDPSDLAFHEHDSRPGRVKERSLLRHKIKYMGGYPGYPVGKWGSWGGFVISEEGLRFRLEEGLSRKNNLYIMWPNIAQIELTEGAPDVQSFVWGGLYGTLFKNKAIVIYFLDNGVPHVAVFQEKTIGPNTKHVHKALVEGWKKWMDTTGGTPAVMPAPPVQTQQQQPTVQQPYTGQPEYVEPTKTCPYCAEKIKAAAVKCRFCGSELGGQTSVQQDPAAQATPGIPHGQFPATVRQDVVINGAVAFRNSESVTVTAISSDVARPEYRYVVNSATLNQQFRLSDRELFVQGRAPQSPGQNSGGQSWQ